MIDSELLDDARTLASLHYLDLVDADSLLRWASEKLVWFPDLKALAQISSEYQPIDSSVLTHLLNELLIELGDRPLDAQRAGWFVAQTLAQRIVGGSIEPEVGARKIWWDVAVKVPSLESRLSAFIGLASEWEDDVKHRMLYERDIVIAAHELIAANLG